MGHNGWPLNEVGDLEDDPFHNPQHLQVIEC